MERLRHRDVLLSLKYSTIEACFSVPMLNLTLPTLPFVLAFAVKGLKWEAGTVGLIAAVPHLCNCLQPVLLSVLSRRLSNYGILLLTFLLGALPWMLALTFPWLGWARDPVFVTILWLATCANSVAAVAWSSAISEVVPERLSGRYFARRNLIFGAWTLVTVLVAGHVVEWSGNSIYVFALLFFLAGCSRLVGLLFLTRMTFPHTVKQKQSRAIALSDLLAVLKHANYLWLCLFIGTWGLLLNLSMPFYTVFVVGKLGLGVGDMVTLTTLASLGGLATLTAWGRLSERFGNKPVLRVCAAIWSLTAMTMWALVHPGWTWHLYVGYFIVGAMTAGFQLVQFNLMVRLAPAALRPAYVAVFMALISIFSALGPILGGQVLRHAPAEVFRVFGLPFQSFHLLFVAGAFGCLVASLTLLRKVKEPAEKPVESVWREMSTMKTFNPMLSIMSVGELLLTPRGLFALGQRSWRSVRQQVKAVGDVGSEILNGGRQVFRRKERRG